MLTPEIPCPGKGPGTTAGPALIPLAQEAGWRTITDAVHAAGGRIFIQLFHAGRMSHPAFQHGDLPVGASPIAAGPATEVYDGVHLFTRPRALRTAELAGWAAMGNPPDTQGLLANKWVKSGSATDMLTPFSLATFASELTAEQFTHGGTVTQSTLGGQKVVLATYPDGSRLYVASTVDERRNRR